MYAGLNEFSGDLAGGRSRSFILLITDCEENRNPRWIIIRPDLSMVCVEVVYIFIQIIVVPEILEQLAPDLFVYVTRKET